MHKNTNDHEATQFKKKQLPNEQSTQTFPSSSTVLHQGLLHTQLLPVNCMYNINPLQGQQEGKRKSGWDEHMAVVQ